MSIPDRLSADLELPEQRLLRDGDRMQDYAGAFLRGDITAQQYSELTLAEINRRAPLDPLLPLGQPLSPHLVEVVEPISSESETVEIAEIKPIQPLPSEASPTESDIARPQNPDAERATVLAQAFVTGRIRAGDFLRLIRDC